MREGEEAAAQLPRSRQEAADQLPQNRELLAAEQQALDVGEAEIAASVEEDEQLDVGVSQELARKRRGRLRRLRM